MSATTKTWGDLPGQYATPAYVRSHHAFMQAVRTASRDTAFKRLYQGFRAACAKGAPRDA